jgi:hypothetical protein
MVLWVHSDASYLSESRARSRVGGHFFLSDPHTGTIPTIPPQHNGAVHTVCNILRNVMASAAEAELAGLFHNAHDAASLRTALIEMGHPQPATPIQTDNLTAAGIVNGTVRQRKSKAMDMRFYWVQDRIKQGHYLVYWRPGSTNLADYFTKHHSTAHHRTMRPVYLLTPSSQRAPASLQGCVHLGPGTPHHEPGSQASAAHVTTVTSVTSAPRIMPLWRAAHASARVEVSAFRH